MGFGYFPDFKEKSKLKDLYLRIFGYPYAPRRNEVLLVFKALNAKKGEKILDIGCGDGVFTNELAKRGVSITGIDISKHDLSLAKKRAKKMNLKTKYFLADAAKMPFPDNYFDKVFSICTFEHIKKEADAFSEVSRILKENGLFILSVPAERNLFLPKILVRLPKNIKRVLFSSLVVESSSYSEYIKKLDKKFYHFRRYSLKKLKFKGKKNGFILENFDYNIKTFGSIPHTLIHTLRLFQWQKEMKTDYQFKSPFIIAFTFPMFYPFYIIDRFLPKQKGLTIVARFKKI